MKTCTQTLFHKQHNVMSYRQRAELNDYLSEIARYPRLSSEQEVSLARRSLAGDKTARDQLINSNLKLVVHIASKIHTSRMPLSDLIQEGNVGLIQAANYYDPIEHPGVRFSTFAGHLIRNSIFTALQDDGIFHVPDEVRALRRVVWAAEDTFLMDNGREPTEKELLTLTGLTSRQINSVRASLRKTISLDAKPEDVDAGSEDSVSIADTIGDDRVDVAHEALTSAMYSEVNDLMQTILTPRERLILALRYGLGALNGRAHTYEEIAKMIGTLQRERIRQIELEALSKLRRAYETGEAYECPGLRQLLMWTDMIEVAA